MADRDDTLRRIDDLFVGQLDFDELEIFNEACRAGIASRSYEGGAGFMGLAKVRRQYEPMRFPR